MINYYDDVLTSELRYKKHFRKKYIKEIRLDHKKYIAVIVIRKKEVAKLYVKANKGVVVNKQDLRNIGLVLKILQRDMDELMSWEEDKKIRSDYEKQRIFN